MSGQSSQSRTSEVGTRLLSRRDALQMGMMAAGVLVGSLVPRVSRSAQLTGAAQVRPEAGEFGITAWVRVTTDNVVTLVLSQAEIGQGISTTMPAILAEELGADWGTVRLETAPFAAAYANPRNHWMFTGNSESIESFYDHMRQMGAAGREMIVAAAAARLGVPASECRTERSRVIHVGSQRHVTFGEVAEQASQLPIPEKPTLRPLAERGLEGRSLPRVDAPAKVDGSAIFGIDFHRPGMLIAAVRVSPRIGGRLKAADRNAAGSSPGFRAAVEIPGGIAVVADTYWHAKIALLSLAPVFEGGEEVSSESYREDLRRRLDTGPFSTPVAEGDALGIIGESPAQFAADYESPFLAHATMEPQNCIATVTDEHCEIWAPTQGQQLAVVALQKALGLREDQIAVNRTPYIGGGFGRRLLPDFIVQAALISRAVASTVKVIWDREEDLAQDSYRPSTGTRIHAAIAGDGYPTAVAIRLVSPTILLPVYPGAAGLVASKKFDPSCLEGFMESRYAIGPRRVDFHLLDTPIRTSMLRTTGYGPNVFALESFIDELAHRASMDPWHYRRRLLRNDARALKVLDAAAALGNWGRPLAAGSGRGIAFADCFGALLAMVIEVSVVGSDVHVRSVSAAVDAGRILDPGISASNIEGGIIFGLAGCLSEITFKAGAAEQTNFNTYLMPTLATAPDIRVEFITSGEKLGGTGEVSAVTVGASLANALFSATGKRIRELPIGRHGFGLV